MGLIEPIDNGPFGNTVQQVDTVETLPLANSTLLDLEGAAAFNDYIQGIMVKVHS